MLNHFLNAWVQGHLLFIDICYENSEEIELDFQEITYSIYNEASDPRSITNTMEIKCLEERLVSK